MVFLHFSNIQKVNSAVTFENKNLNHIKERVDKLSEECAAELRRQGFPKELIEPEIHLNLRYQGTDTALMTLKPADSWDFKSEFVNQYQQEFGFTLPDRDIIVDDIRIRGIGKSTGVVKTNVHDELTSIRKRKVGRDKADTVKQVYFEGGRVATPIYRLENLQTGDEVSGPALLIENNATIVVAPDCSALITAEHVVIQLGDGSKMKIGTDQDPIQLAIFGHRFMSIAGELWHIHMTV